MTDISPAGQRRSRRHGRQLGVRARAVLASVIVVLLALMLGGGGLVYVLAENLEENAENSADARARDVAKVITTIGITETAETLSTGSSRGQSIQIVSPTGGVEQASSTRLRAAPLVDLRPAADTTERTEIRELAGQTGEWTVVARGVTTRGRTFTVIVAVPIDVERAAVRSVAGSLLILTPILLLLTGAATWLLFGWGLGAVERIRREVAAIDARSLTRRVDVPPTGDEVAALATTMNAMLARLEQADRTQRAFISDASHELRSPLATVTAAAELAETATEPRRTRLMQTVRAELTRMRDLVENLMALARSENSSPQLADVDLDDLLTEQRQRLLTTSRRAVVADLQPARILGDESALNRLLRNLLDNAERHATSTIRVQLAAPLDDAGDAAGPPVFRTWIDNDGPTIDPQDRERVFERFVRLDESRSRDVGGSGLGLAIARTIAESHGGTLAVVDSPDGWCRFELLLPAHPSLHTAV